jgi:hypothetical protein
MVMEDIINRALWNLAQKIDYNIVYDEEMDNWEEAIREITEEIIRDLIEAGYIRV